MAAKTSAAIRRALVQTIRNASVYSSLNGIYPDFAPEKVEYPFATYSRVAAVYEDDWSNRTIIAAYDVFVFSRNEVEANNFDQDLADALDGAQLTVEDQTSLLCRRIADIPMPADVDEKGEPIYQVGGSYEIWTDQSR